LPWAAACAVCAALDTTSGWRPKIGIAEVPTLVPGTARPASAASAAAS